MKKLFLRLLDRRVLVSADDSALLEAVLDAAGLLATSPFDSPDLAFRFRMRRGDEPLPDPSRRKETGVSEQGDFRVYEEGEKGWIVLEGGSTARFDLDAGSVEAWVDEGHMGDGWIVGHRLFFVPLLEWLRRQGAFPLHGSGFLVNGRGVVVSGPGRSGKSTAAFAAIAAGCPFLSDDTLFLSRKENRVVMNPYPERVKIGKGTLRFFPEWRDRLSDGGAKFLLEEGELQGVRRADVAPALLLFPEIVSASESSFHSVPPHQAMIRLLPQSVLMADGPVLEEHVSVLVELVQQAPAYLLRFGRDVRRLPERIAEIQV